MPVYRKTTKPATEAQQTERKKFAILNSILFYIRSLVKPSFKAYAKKKNAVNAPFSYNYDSIFNFEDGEPVINYPKLVFSRGQIVTPNGLQISAGTNMVNFTWQPQPQSQFCQFTDKASFLIYHPLTNKGLIRQNVVDRLALNFSMEVPADFSGNAVHCYINFTSADGKQMSNSKYAGEVIC